MAAVRSAWFARALLTGRGGGRRPRRAARRCILEADSDGARAAIEALRANPIGAACEADLCRYVARRLGPLLLAKALTSSGGGGDDDDDRRGGDQRRCGGGGRNDDGGGGRGGGGDDDDDRGVDPRGGGSDGRDDEDSDSACLDERRRRWSVELARARAVLESEERRRSSCDDPDLEERERDVDVVGRQRRGLYRHVDVDGRAIDGGGARRSASGRWSVALALARVVLDEEAIRAGRSMPRAFAAAWSRHEDPQDDLSPLFGDVDDDD